MPDRTGADIVLVNPRFEASYWGLESASAPGQADGRCQSPAFPCFAALTPPPHRVRIVDENVTPIDFGEIARADIVGLTGMSVQRTRMREILSELARRNTFTVVGGPWVSVDECGFGNLSRAIFVGEAEETWPRFLDDWRDGTIQRRYEQQTRTDYDVRAGAAL